MTACRRGVRSVGLLVVVALAVGLGFVVGLRWDSTGVPAGRQASNELSYVVSESRSLATSGADPIYMHVVGAQGDGTGRFAGWIQLSSWSWGMSASASSGVPQFSQVSVSYVSDQATPPILQAIALHQPLRGPVTVDFVGSTATQPVYLQFVLENTVISGYQQSSHGGMRPTDTIALNFGKLEYLAFSPKGRQFKFCWDLVHNTLCKF